MNINNKNDDDEEWCSLLDEITNSPRTKRIKANIIKKGKYQQRILNLQSQNRLLYKKNTDLKNTISLLQNKLKCYEQLNTKLSIELENTKK